MADPPRTATPAHRHVAAAVLPLLSLSVLGTTSAVVGLKWTTFVLGASTFPLAIAAPMLLSIKAGRHGLALGVLAINLLIETAAATAQVAALGL